MTLAELRRALSQAHPHWRVSPAGRLVVDVPLGHRHHRVRVREEDGWWAIEARACHIPDLDEPPKVGDLALQLLQASHDAEGLSFLREEDWVIVRAGSPPDAEVDEVATTVRYVARTADRWELLWTGRDVL